MVTFIEDVLNDLDNESIDLSKIIFILPSRRAGLFLKHKLAARANTTFFAPDILSIEDFVTELSGLQLMTNSELLFRFYDTYLSIAPKSLHEPFEAFSKWAQIVLQDFNEIDRFLVNEGQLFDYLKSIKELEHWSLEKNQTEFTKRYLNFWNQLKQYYIEFGNRLKSDGLGYQGLIYKEALNNLEAYMASTSKVHVFLGFNALNKAEEQIIQELLQNSLAHIYWDIDASFLKNKIHDAGHFIRKYVNGWHYFKRNDFKWASQHYSTKKNVQVIGCPNQIGQAKYAGYILSKLVSSDNSSLKNTALILGNENLLLPTLNALPASVSAVNVTMGMALGALPITILFKKLLSIHEKESSTFYYKDVIDVLNNVSLQTVLSVEPIKSHIKSENSVFLTLEDLVSISPNQENVLRLLFNSWGKDPKTAIDHCITLIYKIKEALQNSTSKFNLELEYLYRFYTLFNELLNINTKFPHLDSISTLRSVFLELLASETLDFRGEPLEGLQIMGMLESRVLDFETVIITSVNEGLLPAGKTQNSFIPYDVKIENGLPTYKEKDAVYTYHFYHLLNRAKNIFILYNTEVDALNSGEMSRFITQLEVEGVHKIDYKIASPHIPKVQIQAISIDKDEGIMQRLKAISDKGFSPSSLSNYIRNPLDFYHQKVLGLADVEEVEETIAANTLGSVIHNSLEDLYRPFVGKYLSIHELENLRPNIKNRVAFHFKDLYKSDSIKQGKNLIIYEIAKRYVSNFISLEIDQLKSGNNIKLLAVELDGRIKINIEDIDYQVHLTGKIDRIDEYNGTPRIIDYKSGKVESRNLAIHDWSEIIRDYDSHSKAFQILCYAYIMYKQNAVSLPVEAGIISFKNLKSGFLKFGVKDKPTSQSKNHEITPETLALFENQLKALIVEICDPKVPFVEKETDK